MVVGAVGRNSWVVGTVRSVGPPGVGVAGNPAEGCSWVGQTLLSSGSQIIGVESDCKVGVAVKQLKFRWFLSLLLPLISDE